MVAKEGKKTKREKKQGKTENKYENHYLIIPCRIFK